MSVNKEYKRRYIVTTYVRNTQNRAENFKRKYFNNLDAVKNFTFVEGLKGLSFDIFDTQDNKFVGLNN